MRGKSNGDIQFISEYTEQEMYLRLIYISTDTQTGEEIKFDYRIEFMTVPSNLGKGEVLYMVCPCDVGYRCRILYLAYDSHKWYSRQYYEKEGQRIYYPSQALSKRDLAYNQRLRYEREIKELTFNRKNFHSHHNGDETKAYMLLKKKCAKRRHWEHKVYSGMLEMMDRYGMH